MDDDFERVDPAGRRTKRRYAHELFPHAEEGEVRPLSVEVPYWYARMTGFRINGSGWQEAAPGVGGKRVEAFLDVTRISLLADALAQGMTGDEAWAWADERVTDDMECAWERAYEVLGEDVAESIKPYPCGAGSPWHEHRSEPDERGMRFITCIPIPEDECALCTEPDPDLTDRSAS